MNDDRLRIVEIFQINSSKKNAYSLFSSSHPLKIYLGMDTNGRKSLAVISKLERVEVFSSNLIDARYEKRTDGSQSLNFSLLDDEYDEIFLSFCEDIIRNTYNSTEAEGFAPIVKRYKVWQNIFKRNDKHLSVSEIKGLIGELLFLEKVLLPQYGPKRSLDAYIGIENEHKDFELGETWYEIKTTHNGSNSVTISSLEQLESDRDGHLEVIVLDAGANSSMSITLNSIVSRIREGLPEDIIYIFDDKMISKGYTFDEYYDSFSFIPIAATDYAVAGDFPRLTNGNTPNGIIKASYDLDLSVINNYKESVWI